MKSISIGLAAAAALSALTLSMATPSPVAAAGGTPIPSAGTSTLPAFSGQPGYALRISMPLPPQNPHMGANPWNNVHNDSWLTDTAHVLGPSGRNVVLTSNRLAEARRNPADTFFDCGSITMDSRGRIVSTCLGPGENSLVMIDPDTLEVLAYSQLPAPTGELSSYGSAYLYVDETDRITVTAGSQVWLMSETGGTGDAGFAKVGEYDFSAAIPAGGSIQSVLPDWNGRLWAMVQSGQVAVLDPRTGAVSSIVLDGQITNSFAVKRNSAFIVTTKRMYRLDLDRAGRPRVTWSAGYENTGQLKPGQKSAGSGTSPTLIDGGKYVAINDNAEQMHVVVYRTAARLPKGTARQVCSTPVFGKGTSASENSIAGWNRAMIIQNTYGYALEPGTWNSPLTAPGLARVDVNADGSGCRNIWQNTDVHVPSVLGKLSTPAGQFFTMTREDDANGLPSYFWTAVDARSGKVAWRALAGTGSRWDAYVPALAIGPSGTLYVGLYDGIAALRDGREESR